MSTNAGASSLNEGDPDLSADRSTDTTPSEAAADDHPRADKPAAGKSKKPLSLRAKILLGAVATIALAGFAVWLIHHETVGKFYEGTDDAYVQADSVTVSPKVAGYVDKVYVVDNQQVEAGQMLVHIDARDFNAEQSQYRAQVEAADANIESARAAVAEQRAAIVQAAAQLAAAEQDARFSGSEVDRYAPLSATGAETRVKLATRQNQAAQALSNVASQRAALSAARLRIASQQAQIRQAQAQRKTAAAQLEAAAANLDSTQIRASIDGRVGDKQVRLGQFVSAGTRLMSVVPHTIYITANFKETQIGLMRIGQPATIEVDALPGEKLQGRVESVAPGTGSQFSLLPPQNATGNFTKIVQRVPVRVAVDVGAQIRPLLIPGLSVTVRVNTINAKDDLPARRDADQGGRP